MTKKGNVAQVEFYNIDNRETRTDQLLESTNRERWNDHILQTRIKR